MMENNAPATNNFLNWVEIKNFKSIKDLRLDCKRVNVFIGKPNVGKSNILEGLGLLGASYNDNDSKLSDFVRHDSLTNLFYDDEVANNIAINTDKVSATIGYGPNLRFFYFYAGKEKWISEVEEALDKYKSNLSVNDDEESKDPFGFLSYRLVDYRRNDPKTNNYEDVEIFRFSGPLGKNLKYGYNKTDTKNPIKKYEFNGINTIGDLGQHYLSPPYGKNLYDIVNRNTDLWIEFAKLFEGQKLEFVLSNNEKTFVLQKKEGPRIKQYSFSSIADTFRRFMFYITAIESNKNSVIIFEEPEVHSFPPYTQDVAYRMIYSEENQFFVSTHSPYLLQTLVSNLGDDQLNVFVTYYEDYGTKVKMLTPEEIGFVQEYSTDIFFNLDRFVPNAQSANPA